MPLVGAYVADTYWGRYKTICVAIGITLIGHILLIVSALPDVIENPKGSVGCFSIAIIIMGLGTGAFKANISPLVAEQYTQTRMRVTTLPSGERVILDPALTTNKIYNWFYLMINVGSLVGQISMVYAEKYVGFWLSYTLPTVVFMFCPLVMFWGRNKYVTHPPAGSVLSKAMRIWFFGMKGRWSINPFIVYKNMNDGSFWERVKPSNFTPESKPSWMTFDDLWVDEVRRGFKACTVFLYFPLYCELNYLIV
jgi:POT family proton-dependent oligopeptide transporter